MRSGAGMVDCEGFGEFVECCEGLFCLEVVCLWSGGCLCLSEFVNGLDVLLGLLGEEVVSIRDVPCFFWGGVCVGVPEHRDL